MPHPGSAPPRLQPTPKRKQLRIHPPTHSPSCPVPPRLLARSWGPRTRCGPCPLGPCSPGGGWGGRGAGGSGGHGCVADRFLASSARPWGWGGGWAQDGPPGSLGLRGVPGAAPPGSVAAHAAAPQASRLLPALRRLCPPPAHKPPGHSYVCRRRPRFSGSQPSLIYVLLLQRVFSLKTGWM